MEITQGQTVDNEVTLHVFVKLAPYTLAKQKKSTSQYLCGMMQAYTK